MTIIVSLAHVTVEVEAEIFERKRGYAWQAAIIDRKSREVLEYVEMKPGRWSERVDAVGDVEDRLTARLRTIQAERDAARR